MSYLEPGHKFICEDNLAFVTKEIARIFDNIHESDVEIECLEGEDSIDHTACQVKLLDNSKDDMFSKYAELGFSVLHLDSEQVEIQLPPDSYLFSKLAMILFYFAGHKQMDLLFMKKESNSIFVKIRNFSDFGSACVDFSSLLFHHFQEFDHQVLYDKYLDSYPNLSAVFQIFQCLFYEKGHIKIGYKYRNHNDQIAIETTQKLFSQIMEQKKISFQRKNENSRIILGGHDGNQEIDLVLTSLKDELFHLKSGKSNFPSLVKKSDNLSLQETEIVEYI